MLIDNKIPIIREKDIMDPFGSMKEIRHGYCQWHLAERSSNTMEVTEPDAKSGWTNWRRLKVFIQIQKVTGCDSLPGRIKLKRVFRRCGE